MAAVVRLGGVLGQLPIEKTFELARAYHADRRKVADRTMTRLEKEKMARLLNNVLHGNKTDLKNTNKQRRQPTNSTTGEEWECLETIGREETMAAYVIMVDQVHKGFTAHISYKVDKVKAKEAVRLATQPSKFMKTKEELENERREELKKAMAQNPDPRRKLMFARRTGLPGKSLAETMRAHQLRLKQAALKSGQPLEVPDEESSSQEDDSTELSSTEESETASEECEEESDGQGSCGEQVEVPAGPPVEMKNGETQTCDACFRDMKKRSQKGRKKKPKVETVDKCTQTTTSYGSPLYKPSKRRRCKWETVPAVKDALEKELCSNIDEKFKLAKEHLFQRFHRKEISPTYENMIHMLAMIAFIEKRSVPELGEEFADQEAFINDFKTAVNQFKELPLFQVQAEFIMEVIDHCPDFAQGLASGLIDAISNEHPTARDLESTTDGSDVDVVTVDSDAPPMGKTAKQIKNAKKKANKKKAKRRQAELLAMEAGIEEDLKHLRFLRLRELKDKVSRGELPKDYLEKEEKYLTEPISNHKKCHTPEDCDDLIEYFSNRVWEVYKATTPNVWGKEEILAWCAEKMKGQKTREQLEKERDEKLTAEAAKKAEKVDEVPN